MRKEIGTLILAVVACACLAGAVSADSAVTFEPSVLTLEQGSSAEVTLWLDQATLGLAGYNMELSLKDPGIAEITSVTYPAWGQMTKEPVVPAQSVVLTAVDIQMMVQNDSARIELATITLQGLSPGTTSVEMSDLQFDADGGAALAPTVDSLAVTVPGGVLPATTIPAGTLTAVLAIAVLVLACAWYQRRVQK